MCPYSVLRLAFYSVLSIPLLLLIWLAGGQITALPVTKRPVARSSVEICGLVGTEAQKPFKRCSTTRINRVLAPFAAPIGFATLLFAASGVFGELQGAMNTIWKVQPKPGRGILGFVKDRFFSFAMVLGTGFLLLRLSASQYGSRRDVRPISSASFLCPQAAAAPVDTIASATVITLLFAPIFKILPDAKIAWCDVWVGAGLTMFVFLIGKAMIGAYLGQQLRFGLWDAGSLVVLVVSVYYSSQIVYFGAEFTQVYARRDGVASTGRECRADPKRQRTHQYSILPALSERCRGAADRVESPGRRGT